VRLNNFLFLKGKHDERKTLFTSRMTVEEFTLHYWYKAELQGICRKHSLPEDDRYFDEIKR
jgi:hypothetical protein